MEAYTKSVNDYINVLKRGKYLFIVPFGLILVITVFIALYKPAIYRSEATILVESQQIPTELIQSTVTSYAEERIQIIKQLVMTRENLYKIIRKYNLYPDLIGEIPVSQIVRKMQQNIFVELGNAQIRGVSYRNRRTQTLAFTVAFEDVVPEITQQVANELVTLFLSENLKARTERASQTTEFLAREADKLKLKMNEIETQVAEFKQLNKDSLPENLSLNMQILDRVNQSLITLDRDIKSAEEQKAYLDVDLATLDASTSVDEQVIAATPEQQLANLEARYAQLSTVYGPAHPDIKKVKRQIADLKSKIQAGSNEDNPGVIVAGSSASMLIQVKIATANSTIVSLKKQRKEIESRIEDLEKRIQRTPQVERAFKSLDRDYLNIKERYEDLRDKETTARLSQSMEEQSKAERFALVEPPLLPHKPDKPNRKKIVLMGLLLAIMGGIGLVFLREQLDGSIHGASQLTHITKRVPLVSIAYIENSKDFIQNKRKLIYAISYSVFIVIIIAGMAVYKQLQSGGLFSQI
jgi:polysaccharide chain length determinant protein (PEP-CTERM system associated)